MLRKLASILTVQPAELRDVSVAFNTLGDHAGRLEDLDASSAVFTLKRTLSSVTPRP